MSYRPAYMYNELIPNCNREERRKIERYMKKHPGLSFTQAYNKLHGTNYVDSIKGDDTKAKPLGDLSTEEVLKYWTKLASKSEDNSSTENLDYNQTDYYNEEDPESPMGVE